MDSQLRDSSRLSLVFLCHKSAANIRYFNESTKLFPLIFCLARKKLLLACQTACSAFLKCYNRETAFLCERYGMLLPEIRHPLCFPVNQLFSGNRNLEEVISYSILFISKKATIFVCEQNSPLLYFLCFFFYLKRVQEENLFSCCILVKKHQIPKSPYNRKNKKNE